MRSVYAPNFTGLEIDDEESLEFRAFFESITDI